MSADTLSSDTLSTDTLGSGALSPDALITHFVGASALILVAAHSGGWLARRLGQPYIVGQLATGIALGPSLLGSMAPDAYAALFPAAIGPALTGLAQFSLVVFLFAVGYELDLKMLGVRARSSVNVALASFAVPMAVGSGCALLFGDALHDWACPGTSPPAWWSSRGSPWRRRRYRC